MRKSLSPSFKSNCGNFKLITVIINANDDYDDVVVAVVVVVVIVVVVIVVVIVVVDAGIESGFCEYLAKRYRRPCSTDLLPVRPDIM